MQEKSALDELQKSLDKIERRIRELDVRIMAQYEQIQPRRFARVITLGVASGIMLAIMVSILLVISMAALGLGIGSQYFE